jgi:hypothetical protein
MPKTTQLALSLVSRPGALAALARTLADAGVNITALSAAEASGRGKIRLLVNDPVQAKRALRKAKVPGQRRAGVRVTTPEEAGRTRSAHGPAGEGADQRPIDLRHHGGPWLRYGRPDCGRQRRQGAQGAGALTQGGRPRFGYPARDASPGEELHAGGDRAGQSAGRTDRCGTPVYYDSSSLLSSSS